MPRSVNPPEYIKVPLLHVSEDKILISVDPGRLGLHPATARSGVESPVPALTKQQKTALRLLSKLATKHEHRLDMEQGDMVFINNLALLHRREAYADPKDGLGRHLVRLWLRNSKLAWRIPDSMKTPWEAAFGPHGNGFPDLARSYVVEPPLEYIPSTYTAGSAAFILEDSENVHGGSTSKGQAPN
jgi:hypothetical protein